MSRFLAIVAAVGWFLLGLIPALRRRVKGENEDIQC